MYKGMTKEEASQIKELVDNGGWELVHNHPILSKIWKNSTKESRNYVNQNVDRD